MAELKEFKLPDVGEGLTEADIVAWHVKPGDHVEVNQIIVEIETAKAVVELPSPWDGTVARLLAGEGQTVDVGTPIIAVDVSGAAAAAAVPAGIAVTTSAQGGSGGPGGSGGNGGTESPPVSGGGLGGGVRPPRGNTAPGRNAGTSGGPGRLRGQGLSHHAPPAQGEAGRRGRAG